MSFTVEFAFKDAEYWKLRAQYNGICTVTNFFLHQNRSTINLPHSSTTQHLTLILVNNSGLQVKGRD